MHPTSSLVVAGLSLALAGSLMPACRRRPPPGESAFTEAGVDEAPRARLLCRDLKHGRVAVPARDRIEERLRRGGVDARVGFAVDTVPISVPRARVVEAKSLLSSSRLDVLASSLEDPLEKLPLGRHGDFVVESELLSPADARRRARVRYLTAESDKAPELLSFVSRSGHDPTSTTIGLVGPHSRSGHVRSYYATSMGVEGHHVTSVVVTGEGKDLALRLVLERPDEFDWARSSRSARQALTVVNGLVLWATDPSASVHDGVVELRMTDYRGRTDDPAELARQLAAELSGSAIGMHIVCSEEPAPTGGWK